VLFIYLFIYFLLFIPYVSGIHQNK